MKKIIFVFLCFSILSIALCKKNSTDSESSKDDSKSSKKSASGFVGKLAQKAVTFVVGTPLKLTWSTSFGVILTPIALPVKILSTAITKIGEVMSVILYDIKTSMEKAEKDLASSSDDNSENSESKSRRRRSAPEEKPEEKSLDKSLEKSLDKFLEKSPEAKPEDKSLEKSPSTFNILTSTNNIFNKCVSFVSSLETKNLFKKCVSFVSSLETKKLLKNCVNFVSNLLHKSDNVGKNFSKLVEDVFIIFKYVKPVYLYIRDELLPSTVERLVKLGHSPLASKKVVHRIAYVKETYKLLELLGYVPSLTTD